MRLPALVSAALVAAGLLVTPSAVAPASPAPLPGVVFGPCSDPGLDYMGLECGTLEVPLDRTNPSGTQVRLALTRKLHTSSTYRGIMLVNPGGPGGSGLSLAGLGDYVPHGVGSTYDWIGFDPRGVGASTPSLHCSTGYFGYNRPSYTPRNKRILGYWLTKSRYYSADCASNATKRQLIRHMTTLDTVRDMDAIRRALGEEKINYYGFSYGTYLGQVYATKYPSHVGRFVLDGVVNPRRVWYAANIDQDRAFNRNIGLYFRYLAQNDASFHLGQRWKKIRRGYFRELRRLDRHPLVNGKLGPDELTDVMTSAGYYVYGWVDLGQAYSDLVRHGRGGPILTAYRDANVGDDNGFAVYAGVQCSDVAWPGQARTLSDARQVNRQAPFLTWANAWFNSPCLTWRAPSHRKLAVSGHGLSPKLLLISETRDAATPYSGALAVRGLFPSASLVAGVGGTTHASSLSGVACVDDTVARYLKTGVTPTRRSGTRADLSCPRLQPPTPTTTGNGRVVARGHVDQLSPMLRRALVSAQRIGR